MRKVLILALAVSCVVGCGVSTYRDTLATSYGYLVWAQTSYKAPCQATPTATTCALITRAIGLHNAATDALNAYCNGTPATGNQSWTNGGPCAPVKSLQGALVAALSALNPVIADVKLLATGKSQPKLTADEVLSEPQTIATLRSVRIEDWWHPATQEECQQEIKLEEKEMSSSGFVGDPPITLGEAEGIGMNLWSMEPCGYADTANPPHFRPRYTHFFNGKNYEVAEQEYKHRGEELGWAY